MLLMLYYILIQNEDSVNQGFVKARFKPYENLEILEKSFELVFVKWVPREQNKSKSNGTTSIV